MMTKVFAHSGLGVAEMLHFKDRTLCSAKCRNDTCPRQFTDELQEQAREWWGHEGAPVAFSYFSKECKDYRP